MGLILVLVCTSTSLLKWLDNIEQKDDFNAFLPATIAIFSDTNPVWVAWR